MPSHVHLLLLLACLCGTTTPMASIADAGAISTLMLKHDPLLHWARRLLPPERAAAVSALYAWCRRLDELVDEPGASGRATMVRLDDWQDRLDDLWAGSPRDAMDSALTETLRAYPSLGRRPFDEMIVGMRSDAREEPLRVERFRPELLSYCYRVAGTVGEMLLPILGLEEEVEPAIALGCAVQLLNICRDVHTDLVDRDRVYLPREDCERLGYDPRELECDIASLKATARYRKLVRLQARRASALLDRAEEAVPRMQPAAAALVTVLIELHRELRRELASRGYDNLSGERVRVGTARKVRISVTAVLRVVLGSVNT
jgi:phytoene synthase